MEVSKRVENGLHLGVEIPGSLLLSRRGPTEIPLNAHALTLQAS